MTRLSLSAHAPAGKFSALAVICAGFVWTTGCASVPPPPGATSNSVQTANTAILAPVSANPDTGKEVQAANSAAGRTNGPDPAEVALLKIEIMSLKEKVATLQRKFDIILKGQRSGLYDDSGIPPISSHFQKPAATKNLVPPLTSEGPIDRFENDDSAAQREKSITLEKPQQLVDRAILLLEQREFGRVAQLLENFQQRFPNNAQSATAELTLAEAYVELKSPQQALTHVRTFYLQHPNDPQLLRAKWLEGRSHELLEAPQKAAHLYREMIGLDPQSQLALRARAALEKLNGGGTQ